MAKSNKISILQIGEGLISRVRLAPAGKSFEILACEKQTGPWSAADGSLETAAADFFKENPIGDDAVYSVLPRHDVTARILTLPTHDEDEAASMVSLSAEEFVPYSAADLTIDQCILQKLPGGESKVLAVLVHKDIINTHINLLAKSGITPDHVFLSTACLASAAVAARGAQPEQFALVNLAAGGLEVAVVEAGKLLYTRGVATHHNWNDIHTDEQVLEELVVETRSSLATYRRESEDGIAVDTLFLTSDDAPIDKTAQTLSEELEKNCAVPSFTAALVAKGADKTGLPLLTALGAALAAQNRAIIRIDLVPDDVTRVRDLAAAKRNLIQGTVLTAIMLVAAGILYGQAVHQRQGLLKALRAQEAALAPSAQEVEAKLERLKILKEQVDHEGTPLEVLAGLTAAAPPDLNLLTVHYKRGSGVELIGRAKTRDISFEYVNRLHRLAEGSLAFFANARNLYERPDRVGQQNIVVFRTTIPFGEGDQ